MQVISSPHIYKSGTVTDLMLQVLYALMPGIGVYVWYFGWGIVVNLLLASVTALAVEALMLRLRNRPLRLFLTDGSALVCAWLLALAISPLAPWHITILGVAFGLIFAKHLYGGLGNNPFNPAMAGYAMLIICFPVEMTRWPAEASLNGHFLGFMDSLRLIFLEQTPAGLSMDAITRATPLDAMRVGLGQLQTVGEIRTAPLFGYFSGKGWEWIGSTFFLGGCWLIYKRVITWHIPAAVLGSLLVFSEIFYLLAPERYPSPLFHLFSGAAILCAFFIATDPVSAATSMKGRLVYGAGIGILIYVIRAWGGYPDGVAFAVLLMNMSAPTIDYYTQPRAFGHADK
ncbi:MAG: electron transport complex subunit RsxD [Gammaproteobacteria bacterium]|nr:electron transport complex subunit RsxD [Gammaproteobacteria bacterium]